MENGVNQQDVGARAKIWKECDIPTRMVETEVSILEIWIVLDHNILCFQEERRKRILEIRRERCLRIREMKRDERRDREARERRMRRMKLVAMGLARHRKLEHVNLLSTMVGTRHLLKLLPRQLQTKLFNTVIAALRHNRQDAVEQACHALIVSWRGV